MSDDLARFAEYAEAMAQASHTDECRAWVCRPPRMARWEHPDPDCLGCVTAADRAMWARLATECRQHQEDM